MVSKCANPECTTPFRYFQQGKLFRLETKLGPDRRRALGDEDSPTKSMHRLEFYWLCDRCAEKMTLVADKESGISVRPRLSAIATAA
jgi:phage terminase large subunit GpA-like protein